MLKTILNNLDPANTPTPDFDGRWETLNPQTDINYFYNESTNTLVIVAYPVENGKTNTALPLTRWILHTSDKHLANDPEAWVRTI